MSVRSILARLAGIATCATLAACAGDPLTETPEPIGDFRLGHAIAVVEDTTKGPFSREVDPQMLKAELEQAVRARLGRYDGDGLYHLGMAVAGYVLAQPGIPVVYTPKSVLIVDVTVFDNATREKLTPEPKRITAFEGLEKTVPILGSGLTRSAEDQLKNLVTQAAVQIENWLRENPDLFVPEPGAVRVPFDPVPSN